MNKTYLHDGPGRFAGTTKPFEVIYSFPSDLPLLHFSFTYSSIFRIPFFCGVLVHYTFHFHSLSCEFTDSKLT